MILYLDTETSGLYRDALAVDDPAQPHLLQIASKLTEDDGLTVRGRYTAIIRPDGWSIEPEALALHGITERQAHRIGAPVIMVMVAFRSLAEHADMTVGHNVQFDRRIISMTLRRLGSSAEWFDRATSFWDTMERATKIMRLPSEFGFKFPTLEQAHEFFVSPFNPFISRHDAEEDMEATARIYLAMRSRGIR